MPFKSQAQRRKFAELLVKGEISPETYEQEPGDGHQAATRPCEAEGEENVEEAEGSEEALGRCAAP